MKKISFIVFYTFGFFFFSSCNDKGKDENIYINKETKIIKIPEEIFQTDSSDSVFSSFKFLPLETNDNCLISFIVNLKVENELIYINDGFKRLLVFDSKGNFRYQIGSIGNGPGEYLEMRDYLIFEDHIEILDFKKILTYSLTGEYISTKHFDFSAQNQYCNAEFFAVSPLGGYYFWGGTLGIKDFSPKLKRYLMYHIDSKMNMKEGYFLISHGSGSSFFRFTEYDDLILMEPSFGNHNIYQINKKGEISSRYYFDFGKNKYPKPLSNINKHSPQQVSEEVENYIVETLNFLETKNWIHIDFVYKNRVQSVFYSKKKNKVYLVNSFSENYSKNKFRFWGALFAQEEALIMPVEPSWLHLELDRMSPEEIKELNLESYKDKDESDNPVLVYYNLR